MAGIDSPTDLVENGGGEERAQNDNKLGEPLKSMQGIARGDHLVVKRTFHLHHVLALEDITDPNKTTIEVIEYKHPLERKVVKSKISVNTKKDLWYRSNDNAHKMSSDQIDRAIKKAEAQIGFKSYSQTCANTCENFVHWCLSETIYRQPVSDMYDIKRGDHIIQCGVFDKHMLAYEDGSPDRPLEVIQYTPRKVDRSKISLNPSKQSILRVVYPENCMVDGIFNNPDMVLRKAESQIGFKKYSSERNNGEHFVNWCKTETGHRERVNKMSDIKLGDHIIYVRGSSIDHHYLAVENGKDQCHTVRVIQYKGKKVVEGDVKLTTKGGRLYRFADDDDNLVKHNVEEIISQAKRQLGEKKYCDDANDNEHFVYWCKTRAEHRERISNLEQLRDGDHLIIRKYRGLKEHHSLVVENEFREMEIIYYDSNKVSKDSLSIDPSKHVVFRSYRNPCDKPPLLRKEKFGQKARGEIGKSFYCIGDNGNKHFVKWCMVNTEIIEEVNKIDEIFTNDWFILFNRRKNKHQLYLATGNGHKCKIDAKSISYYLQSPSTNQTRSVNVHPAEQIFRIVHLFEESPINDMRYNFVSNMKNGQSVYGSLFVKMMHLMKPDPTRAKPVTRAADIRKGDQLMRCRLGGLYYHHLLAVENGSCSNKIKVIHFSKSSGVKVKIIEEEIEIDTEGGHYFVVLYNDCDDPDTVVERARQKLGEKGYSLESNNCEHFVTKCKIGSKQCDQLNYGGRRVLAALAAQSFDAFRQEFLGPLLLLKASASVAADVALVFIFMSAFTRGLSPLAFVIQAAAATMGIAAGVVFLSEGFFLVRDAIKVKRKLNQVRYTQPEKHDIFTRQLQLQWAFLGGLFGTIVGGMIGQVFIPLPIAGFAIGSVVGGFVGRLIGISEATDKGRVAYEPNGIDVYMDFLRSVRRNKILHQ